MTDFLTPRHTSATKQTLETYLIQFDMSQILHGSAQRQPYPYLGSGQGPGTARRACWSLVPSYMIRSWSSRWCSWWQIGRRLWISNHILYIVSDWVLDLIEVTVALGFWPSGVLQEIAASQHRTDGIAGHSLLDKRVILRNLLYLRTLPNAASAQNWERQKWLLHTDRMQSVKPQSRFHARRHAHMPCSVVFAHCSGQDDAWKAVIPRLTNVTLQCQWHDRAALCEQQSPI